MVYRDAEEMLGKPLGTMIVDELMLFSAKMKSHHESNFNISSPIPTLSALQTKAGNLEKFSFYIPPEDPFYSLYRETPSVLPLQNILLAPKSEDAHLKIRTSSPANLLVIELTDKRVTRHGVNIIADQVKPDSANISWIMERAARYYRELDRTSFKHYITAKDCISVEFFKLDPPVVRPLGWTTKKLTRIGPNLCKNKVIDFEVDEDEPYGACIKNNTLNDLYVNVFSSIIRISQLVSHSYTARLVRIESDRWNSALLHHSLFKWTT